MTALRAIVAFGVAALGLLPFPLKAFGTCPNQVTVYSCANCLDEWSEEGGLEWVGYLAGFSTTHIPGRRYVLEVTNGSPSILGINVFIDGQEWIGASELNGAGSLTRIVNIDDTQSSHSFTFYVYGCCGANASVRVYHESDPTFRIFGTQVFNRQSPTAEESHTFQKPAAAGEPYLLNVINGAANGTHRSSSGTLRVNGTDQLYFWSLGIPVYEQLVSLQSGTNTVSILNDGEAG